MTLPMGLRQIAGEDQQSLFGGRTDDDRDTLSYVAGGSSSGGDICVDDIRLPGD